MSDVISKAEHREFAAAIDRMHDAMLELDRLWHSLNSRDHYGALGEDYPENWGSFDEEAAKVLTWLEHQRGLGRSDDRITDRDVAFQVEQTLPPKGSPTRGDIDVEAVTAAIIERYGLVNIDTIDHDEYWQIVREHDASQS